MIERDEPLKFRLYGGRGSGRTTKLLRMAIEQMHGGHKVVFMVRTRESIYRALAAVLSEPSHCEETLYNSHKNKLFQLDGPGSIQFIELGHDAADTFPSLPVKLAGYRKEDTFVDHAVYVGGPPDVCLMPRTHERNDPAAFRYAMQSIRVSRELVVDPNSMGGYTRVSGNEWGVSPLSRESRFAALRAEGKKLGEINAILEAEGFSEVTGPGVMPCPTTHHEIIRTNAGARKMIERDTLTLPK